MILESFSLRGKNALVTGSRTGLGAGMAIGLAQAGANLVVHDRDESGIDEVCAAVRQAALRLAQPAHVGVRHHRGGLMGASPAAVDG